MDNNNENKLEKLTKKEVIRLSIAGIMGTFGAALISLEKYSDVYKTTLLKQDELNEDDVAIFTLNEESVSVCDGERERKRN